MTGTEQLTFAVVDHGRVESRLIIVDPLNELVLGRQHTASVIGSMPFIRLWKIELG